MNEQKATTKDDLDAFVAAWRTMGVAVQRAYQQIAQAMKPLVEFANSPQGQALIAEHKRREALGLNLVEGCHCLCGVRHPDRQLCLGEFPSRDIVTVRINGVDVPMCPPCSAAEGGTGG